nr:DUF6879 family protein [Streptomyces sp. R301]
MDAYRRFLDGETVPDDYNADRLDEVGAWTRSGRGVYRVHVLRRPLTLALFTGVSREHPRASRSPTVAQTGRQTLLLEVNQATSPRT